MQMDMFSGEKSPETVWKNCLRPTTDEISPQVRAKYSEFPDDGQYLADQRLGQGYDPSEPIIFLTNDLTRQILNKNEQRLNTIKESKESDFCYGTSNLKSNFGEPHECMIALRESIDCLLKSENQTLNYSKTRSNMNYKIRSPNCLKSISKPRDISRSHSENFCDPTENFCHPNHAPCLDSLVNLNQKILDQNFDSKTHNRYDESSGDCGYSQIFDVAENQGFDRDKSFNKISMIKKGKSDWVRNRESLDEDMDLLGGEFCGKDTRFLVDGKKFDKDLTGEYN
jgi:hypothetical protein